LDKRRERVRKLGGKMWTSRLRKGLWRDPERRRELLGKISLAYLRIQLTPCSGRIVEKRNNELFTIDTTGDVAGTYLYI
jgi:hypothetical protein